jgi:hypothetical protein
MEQWKDIPGYEGRYQVSDAGTVRGAKGPLAAQRQNSGYLVVHLYIKGSRRVRLVHALVAQAFVPGFFPGAHVNHKNGRKADNTAVNLEWVTRSENMRHAVANGLTSAPKMAVRGVSVDDGHVVYFDSQLRAERTLAGRATSAIHHCLVGKKKSAYGYTWSRA